jgi:hypothetical protein
VGLLRGVGVGLCRDRSAESRFNGAFGELLPCSSRKRRVDGESGSGLGGGCEDRAMEE